MATPKTSKNKASALQFIKDLEHDGRREDSLTLLKMMEDITQTSPAMWGTSIIGFDEYHYVYDSGREGDWPIVGFSPRKQNLSVYIMPGFAKYDALLSRLGKHKIGKSCLYINKLADIDLAVLSQLIEQSVTFMRKRYH